MHDSTWELWPISSRPGIFALGWGVIAIMHFKWSWTNITLIIPLTSKIRQNQLHYTEQYAKCKRLCTSHSQSLKVEFKSWMSFLYRQGPSSWLNFFLFCEIRASSHRHAWYRSNVDGIFFSFQPIKPSSLSELLFECETRDSSFHYKYSITNYHKKNKRYNYTRRL